MGRETTVKGLRRERPGRYRSADDRFAIEQAGTVWYLTDEARRDELGLALVLGPYASLAEARDAVAAEPSVLTWKGKAAATKPTKKAPTKKAPTKGKRG